MQILVRNYIMSRIAMHLKADHSDNPNGSLGILGNCKNGGLFVENTWNSTICDVMKPQDGDLIVQGKKGLDAFPGTNLEQLLTDSKIQTVVLGERLTRIRRTRMVQVLDLFF